MKKLCVFCGSNSGAKPEYLASAKALGKLLCEERIGLVYGGASVGLMGVLADTVLAGGGHVTGVIPQHLVAKEVAHQGLTDLRIVQSMHERKALMADLSDGFIAMPGGFGTLEEFCEVLTWSQLGLHTKPTGLLNTAGFYDQLLAWMDSAVQDQFIREGHRQIVLSSDEPRGLFKQMQEYRPSVVGKWLK